MPPSPKSQILAQRLIAAEFRRSNPSDTQARAAFRVCEKLRPPLSTLAGAAGFRSLLSRALTLASGEVLWLDRLRIKADGALELPAEIEAQLDPDVVTFGGNALVSELAGLLLALVGDALTLRLVQEVWPKAK